MTTPRVAMTIAGTDSGGGAGIAADLKTFAAFKVHGTFAVTAVTAQSTLTVSAICPIEPEMVATQVVTVTEDIHVDAVKTGMLCVPATVLMVARLIEQGALDRVVVDPVLVSSTGHHLMERGGIEAYRDALLPHAFVTTPNLREAAVLLGVDVRDFDSLEAMTQAAHAIRALGPTWVVVKGGHYLEGGATDSQAPDVLVGQDVELRLETARVSTANDHGTGCSMAAAIAANVALGLAVPTAVAIAKDFVNGALQGAAGWQLGHGHGPIDHLGFNAS